MLLLFKYGFLFQMSWLLVCKAVINVTVCVSAFSSFIVNFWCYLVYYNTVCCVTAFKRYFIL